MTAPLASAYPDKAADRDLWIVDRRGPRETLDPEKPYAFFVEDEHFANGTVGPVATIFLTNRECPWKCAMCDLWRNTLQVSLPPGVIPRQIGYALKHLPFAQQIKLYNSGSFFDPRAIPTEDHAVIAGLVAHFERVIVECHPSLVGESCFAFKQKLSAELEVAMGLETTHPEVLEKLNKRMTLDQYAAAADRLRTHDIALRSFILVQPPFMRPDESLEWACRSIDFALNCGSSVMTLIPTRAGNGAVEQLASDHQFQAPDLLTIENALDYGIARSEARVFFDAWDTAGTHAPLCCRAARLERLKRMNLTQQICPRVVCKECGNTA